MFTISSSKTGNKKLTYPVGLITSDEVVYAGGFGGKNNTSYYLYTNKNYWTLSPSLYNGSYAYVLLVVSDGCLRHDYNVSGAYAVRPVINLKSNTIMTGTGSETDPYVVVA